MKIQRMNGWFERIMGGFINQDFPWSEENGSPPTYRLESLWVSLAELEYTGVARISRRGWYTIDHPSLGQLSWKSGIGYTTGTRFLVVRRGGKVIMHFRAKEWLEPIPPKQVRVYLGDI
jgi:hypothetical protein